MVFGAVDVEAVGDVGEVGAAGLVGAVGDSEVGDSVGSTGVVISLGVGELDGDGVAEPVGDGVGDPVGAGSLLLPDGVVAGDGVEVWDVPDGTGGASPRIVRISALNSSSWATTSARVNDVMLFPNSVSLSHTAPSASSCSSPGVSSTDSTSWLAIAAVMQR